MNYKVRLFLAVGGLFVFFMGIVINGAIGIIVLTIGILMMFGSDA